MTNSTTTPADHRLLGDRSWHARAACQPNEHRPLDPDIFFPDADETDKIAAAKAICGQCPVQKICLDSALEEGDFGIRGGQTEEEREPLRKEVEIRLDYSRVNAALAGRDIHLTQSERSAIVHAAYHDEVPVDRLVRILKVSEQHTKKLYRDVRRAIRDRAAQEAKQAEANGATENKLGADDFGMAA